MSTIFDPRTEDEKEAASMLYARVEPEVLSARKAAIRDALRVPNADVYEVLKGQLGEEVVMQRLEALIVRAVEGDTFAQVGCSFYILAEDLIGLAARDGLDAAVRAEIAERAR